MNHWEEQIEKRKKEIEDRFNKEKERIADKQKRWQPKAKEQSEPQNEKTGN